MKHIKGLKTYSFNNLNIEELIVKHIELSKDKINKDSLYPKYIYLINQIISAYKANKQGVVILKANILQNVLGSKYNEILDVLCNFKIISINQNYKVGVYCRSINLLDPFPSLISDTTTSNIKVIQFINKTDKLLKEINKKNVDDSVGSQSNEMIQLVKTYNEKLKLLRVKDKNELQKYLDERNYTSLNQKNYYEVIAKEYNNNYKTFKIVKIDENQRLYSILSSTPRYLKNFINIKFSCDVSNSHPLLFNYFIIEHYKIPEHFLKQFYTCIIDKQVTINKNKYNINNKSTDINKIKIDKNKHIDINSLLNSLNICNLEKGRIANIPKDIWLYIANTSQGVFWDDFKDKFTEYGLNRIDVKTTIFQEIFYSHKNIWKETVFAKAFRKKYPTVFDLLKTMKEEKKKEKQKYISKNTTDIEIALAQLEAESLFKHISNDMMKLESEIFQKILTKLYRKRGCNVLSIHDAIVLLDTKGSQKYKEEDITKVIKQVYEEYNLSPQLSIDKYDSKKWQNELRKQKEQSLKVNQKISELNEKKINGDENIIELLSLIDNNQAEIVINENGKFEIHRLFKHKIKNEIVNQNYDIIKHANNKIFNLN